MEQRSSLVIFTFFSNLISLGQMNSYSLETTGNCMQQLLMLPGN